MSTQALKQIEEQIQSNNVILFMKGTPSTPYCGFSATVVKILNHLGAPFKAIDVLEDNAIREGVKLYSDWPTIPQLYINGEFIGGCDIVTELFESGELQEKLKFLSTQH